MVRYRLLVKKIAVSFVSRGCLVVSFVGSSHSRAMRVVVEGVGAQSVVCMVGEILNLGSGYGPRFLFLF